jgi:LacI family transcriptional regulator
MATIRDVAKRAGVAPITVSRVINNSGYVNEKTRARVEAAIADLGYVPNVLARSLRSRRTDTLGLILTDISNPFWTTVARGVEDAASDAGFNVILCNTDESETEEDKYLHVLVQKQVDGVLLVPARSVVEPIKFVQSQNTSVVVLDRRIPNSQTDVVRCDSEDGAYQLTCLLLSLGHRRIAMLSGPRGVSTAEDRVAGYGRALAEAGVGFDAAPVCYGKFSLESGYDMTLQVLARTPRPSALFAGNNFIAIGALRALRDAGLRVPEDLALVGFDDLPEDLVVDPFLTVAAQPAYEMGRQATELLLARLSEETPAAYQEIVLPTVIVVRESSGQVLEQQSG